MSFQARVTPIHSSAGFPACTACLCLWWHLSHQRNTNTFAGWKACTTTFEHHTNPPLLRTAHAVHHTLKLAPTLSSEESVLICLSGRGDKDVEQAARFLEGPGTRDAGVGE